MDRRTLLISLGLAFGPSALRGAYPALAAEPADKEGATPFSFEHLCARMKALAGEEFRKPDVKLAKQVRTLTYDGYRAIRYRPDLALWRGRSPFELQAFHMGWLFRDPVRLHAVEEGTARPLTFSGEDFEYRPPLDPAHFSGLTMPGTSGFRLHYPLNDPRVADELVVFQGASYFRALGRHSLYGLSARGIAVNTVTRQGEEFPRFSDFYIEVPGRDAREITIYAALEGKSLTGAYAFRIVPGDETLMDVKARLYIRKDIERLGVAPMTSMFLFGENNRHAFDDFRGEVHDSDGLEVVRASGERLWRSLNNPSRLATSFFSEVDPASFGLIQRDRRFGSYQDGSADYQRRPSLVVEPLGKWGKGWIQLVEIPTQLETNDNIVAYWTPEGEVRAGEERSYDYRLRWSMQTATDGGTGRVVGLRTGHGGVSGVDEKNRVKGERKFVVDFGGGPLDSLTATDRVEAKVHVGGASGVKPVVSRVEPTGLWRLVIDLVPESDEPVELSAFLEIDGKRLTETWLYQWRRTDGKTS